MVPGPFASVVRAPLVTVAHNRKVTAPRHSPPPPRVDVADPHFDRLRRWSYLLDRAFRVPGTQIRFGWDPIVGLIPGLGDISSPLFAAFILLQARRMRVPRIVQARMIINAMVDAMLGFVPILGNLADVGWKANTWNMRLLERHAVPGVPPRRGDAIFVYAALAMLAIATLLPILFVAWVLWRFGWI